MCVIACLNAIIPCLSCLCRLVQGCSSFICQCTRPNRHLVTGNQVAQSIRAASKESTPLEASHANAAHAQGMLSASIAILELAGGGGAFDADGNLEITADHVQAGLPNKDSLCNHCQITAFHFHLSHSYKQCLFFTQASVLHACATQGHELHHPNLKPCLWI